ncbi:hypothetical protein Lal_00025877 [Lupinus albus]|nr:hypothetical protein Lal_00025877 [Lupinus albus]
MAYIHSALQADKSDTLEWRHDKSNKYTVKSAYSILTNQGQDPSSKCNHTHLLWKSRTPLKVTSFAWRLFQNRTPTKAALFRQDVYFSDGGGILCSFCNELPKTSTHLFSSCDLSYAVWQLIYKWLDISVVLPLDPIQHLMCHMGMVKDRKLWKFWSVIWFASIWAIWLSRNDFIFNNVRPSLLHILDSAKVNSWIWLKCQCRLNSSLYAD